jgi:hypothetical protein
MVNDQNGFLSLETSLRNGKPRTQVNTAKAEEETRRCVFTIEPTGAASDQVSNTVFLPNPQEMFDKTPGEMYRRKLCDVGPEVGAPDAVAVRHDVRCTEEENDDGVARGDVSRRDDRRPIYR